MGALVLASLALACGGGGSKSPSTANLQGWWFHDGPTEQVVFGFVPAAEALSTLPLDGLTVPEGADVSAVSQRGAGDDAAPVLLQVTSYEVREEVLYQTVIGAVNAVPGTEYATQIVDFAADSMTIESMNDPSGMRSYVRVPRCPTEAAIGWTRHPGQLFGGSATSGGASIAVDPQGHVHALIGLLGAGFAGQFPMYWFFGDGCDPLRATLPAFYRSAIAVRDGEVHTLLELLAPGLPEQSAIVHRWRSEAGADWQVEPVAPTPPNGFPVHVMHLFLDGDGLVALVGRTDGALELYRRDAAGWQAAALDPGVVPARVEHAAIGPDGAIVVLTNDRVRRIVGAAVEDIALPRLSTDFGINGTVALDAEGRVHAVWAYEALGSNPDGIGGFVVSNRMTYGVLTGSSWTELELGPGMHPRLILGPDGVTRVIHGIYKQNSPMLGLLEVGEDGSLTGQRLARDEGLGSGSPETFARFAAAQGADGTLATTFSGDWVDVRFGAPIRARPDVAFTIEIAGPGRVRSLDGAIECAATCTTQVPLGTRLALAMAPDPGYEGIDEEHPNGFHQVYGWAWHDAVPEAGALAVVSRRFQFVAQP